MKKIKFCAWAFAFMLAIFLPIPFAIAWGWKAIPIVYVCGVAVYKIYKILASYDI